VIKNGATQEEADFIVGDGQRVELNAMTSAQFIEFVERKLQDHGVAKVVPDDETLRGAWERAVRVGRMNAVGRGEQVDANAPIPPAPEGLSDRIREAFEEDDKQAWDDALRDIAEGTS
jgi:hypothetical protein